MKAANVALKAVFLALSFLASPFFGVAQDIYREDVDQLIADLEQTHPDVYGAFGSKEAFDAAERELRAGLRSNMSKEEFANLVGLFLTKMHDLHTGLLVDGGRRDTRDMKKSPILMKPAQDGLFVYEVADKSLASLIGRKVTGLAGRPTDYWLGKVASIAPMENRYGALSWLSSRLVTSAYAERLIPGFKGSLSLDLGGQAKTIEMDYPINHDWVFWLTKSNEVARYDRPFLSYKFIDDVAYLCFDQVMAREAFEFMRNSGQSNIRDWVDSFLRQALHRKSTGDLDKDIALMPSLSEKVADLLGQMKEKNSRYLIIDLTRNGGGWTPIVQPILYMMYGDAFYSTRFPFINKTKISPLYLRMHGMTLKDFNQANNTQYKMGDFITYGADDTPAPEKRNLALASARAASHPFSFMKYVEPLNGKAIHTPQVLFLISPSTGSAAYHFMWWGWHLGAKTVGVTPAQAGNCFMEQTPFELKNTKLMGSISNCAQICFPDDEKMGKEFIPDFPMTVEIFNKYDCSPNAELEYALDLIRQGKL